ncbi:MAG: exodeoxyribonuclease V subunit gamma [Marmoricola sp.]
MVVRVHRAARADGLADGLAALLADPLSDPFARELVVVPAKGVERWLSQRLSHRLGPAAGADDGVCAGVDFWSPGRLVAALSGRLDDDPWAPQQLTWPLLGVIDAAADEGWCHTLSTHLGHFATGEERELRRGRRFAVARRLARLFTSYAEQRPALLEAWESGDDTDGTGAVLAEDLSWQPELWRRLVAAVDGPSPVVRHREVVAALRSDGPLPSAELPARLSLFGHTRLPVTEIALLAALGEHRDVHLWLPHPSPELWAALEGTSGGASVRRTDDTSYEAVRHPLLATLGRDVRELQRALPGTVVDAGALAGAAPPATLLGRLQADIAANRPPSRLPADPADRSVQVHSCHGPARQVEVLREVLLGLLADDPGLEPRDIVVMCPDIEAYAPLVNAAFGLGDLLPDAHPGQQLRVRLADRALTQTNPLLGVADQVLTIAGGRAEASRVLDLLATDPVRRRFGFSDADLETITGWVDKAGVRWAFDAEHRRDFGLAAYMQNTWRFGLDRVLAGVAMSEDAERWIDTTLPLDDVASTDIDLAGRLAEFLDRLQHLSDALVGAHPVAHWLTALAEGMESLTAVRAGDEWQLGQLQRELAGLLEGAARTGRDTTTLRLPDVRALLSEQLAGRPTRANFRTGTLTICTMVPMRSVPHRVVCLLGLDDGVFPRNAAVDGDNALARHPLTGERDPRSEDRQLLLDAVLAATDHLVITYSGRNEVNGEPRPPAVPLGELIDTLAAMDPGHDPVQRQHPLQAFHPGNLTGTPPFCFDRTALDGARAASSPRTVPERLADLVLPPVPCGDVELDDLVGFLKDPVRTFLRRRLGIALLDDEEAPGDTLPVELDGLAEWNAGERVLRALIAGRDPDHALQAEWRRGTLPPGQLGWAIAKRIRDGARPVADLVQATTGGVPASAHDVDVDLGDRRLVGTVTDLHDRRVVKVGYSRLGPKSLLEAWVSLLALEAAEPGRGWTAGAVGRGERGAATARLAFAPPEDPAALLRDLLEIYDAGLCEPLPLPVRTAHAWADGRRRNPAMARKRAGWKWTSDRYPGEDAAPAHVRVWGERFPLRDLLALPPRDGEDRHLVEGGEASRLGALASRIWLPLLGAAR